MIQDKHARATPGKAIGFMFIPLFNFYWAFQAIWGCSKDYNKYIKRYSLSLKPLSEGLFLVACIALFCSPLIGGILFAPVIQLLIFSFIVNNLCDSINALAQPETRVKISEFKQPSISSRWHPLPEKYQR